MATSDIHVPRGLGLGLSMALSLLCLSACGKSNGPPQSAPPPPEVNVAAVVERKVQDWDDFTGKLQAIESVEIRPRVSGYIDKVTFTEGKLVKAGDLLFVIDPRPYQAERDRNLGGARPLFAQQRR